MSFCFRLRETDLNHQSQKKTMREKEDCNTNLPDLEQFLLICSQPAYTCLAISVQFPRPVIPAQ